MKGDGNVDEKKYIFIKTHEMDKDKFAELLEAAKGQQTMKEFALYCHANPSTFTRIIQKSNKGASSPSLLKAIAENADPNSGVTLESLAYANGYTIDEDKSYHQRHTLYDLMPNGQLMEIIVRDILVKEIIDRGGYVCYQSTNYSYGKTLQYRPDALVQTDIFGKKDEVWCVEYLHTGRPITDYEEKRLSFSLKRRIIDRIATFTLISINNDTILKPTRFSIVVIHNEIYNILVNEFSDIVMPIDMSFILIDTDNYSITDELILPKENMESRQSYFKTTQKINSQSDQETYKEDFE